MLKRLLFKINGKFINLYNRIFKPFSAGVRAIVVDSSQRILLVKHTYTDKWYLPGGGVKKKEHLVDALSRELKEEVGLELFSSPKLLGIYANFVEYKSDFVIIFIVENFKITVANDLEIESWKWFDLHGLPKDISPGTGRRIQEYLGNRIVDYRW